MEKRLCSKLGIALIIVGSVFLLGVAAALAASSSGLQSSPLVSPNSDLNAGSLSDDDVNGTQPITGGAMIAKVISDTFTTTITITDIWSLRTGTYEVSGQPPITRSFGWGQIFKLCWLASVFDDGLDVETLVISRTQGMGWGQIARALDQHPGNKGSNLGSLMRNAKKDNSNKPTQEAAQTSSTSSPGQGNAYGHNKEGNQGHGNQGQGNPHNGDNPGQGHGKGHDKGKKH